MTALMVDWVGTDTAFLMLIRGDIPGAIDADQSFSMMVPARWSESSVVVNGIRCCETILVADSAAGRRDVPERGSTAWEVVGKSDSSESDRPQEGQMPDFTWVAFSSRLQCRHLFMRLPSTAV